MSEDAKMPKHYALQLFFLFLAFAPEIKAVYLGLQLIWEFIHIYGLRRSAANK